MSDFKKGCGAWNTPGLLKLAPLLRGSKRGGAPLFMNSRGRSGRLQSALSINCANWPLPTAPIWVSWT